jgi:hypothetical protein
MTRLATPPQPTALSAVTQSTQHSDEALEHTTFHSLGQKPETMAGCPLFTLLLHRFYHNSRHNVLRMPLFPVSLRIIEGSIDPIARGLDVVVRWKVLEYGTEARHSHALTPPLPSPPSSLALSRALTHSCTCTQSLTTCALPLEHVRYTVVLLTRMRLCGLLSLD